MVNMLRVLLALRIGVNPSFVVEKVIGDFERDGYRSFRGNSFKNTVLIIRSDVNRTYS
jgi:hypothetical protein